MQSWESHSVIVNDVDGYNTVAVEWTPDWYIFYVNDVFTFIATRGVSHIDEYIILSEEPRFWKDLPDSVRNGATVHCRGLPVISTHIDLVFCGLYY